MLRTGRVDAVVPMPYPDFDARIEILKIHSQLKINLPLAKDVDFAKIAEKTQYWSGSDLEQLVIRTARETMKKAIMNGERKSGKIRRITQDDFEEEIRNFKIDIERNKKMHERMKELAQQFTNDARLLSIFEETASKLETKTRIERIKKLRKARKIAMKKLNYVYTGNLPDEEGNTTYCPKCKKALIIREGFFVKENNIKNGKCECGEKIAGVWK